MFVRGEYARTPEACTRPHTYMRHDGHDGGNFALTFERVIMRRNFSRPTRPLCPEAIITGKRRLRRGHQSSLPRLSNWERGPDHVLRRDPGVQTIQESVPNRSPHASGIRKGTSAWKGQRHSRSSRMSHGFALHTKSGWRDKQSSLVHAESRTEASGGR